MKTIHTIFVRLSAFSEPLEGGLSAADRFLADFVEGGLFELSVGTDIRTAISADDPAVIGRVIVGDEFSATERI